MENKRHIGMLGKTFKDVVTGFQGVASSVSFDLYGCVQAVLTPPTDKEGKIQNGNWFDVTRLVLVDGTIIMSPPDFSAGYIAEGKKGCASKTLPGKI